MSSLLWKPIFLVIFILFWFFSSTFWVRTYEPWHPISYSESSDFLVSGATLYPEDSGYEIETALEFYAWDWITRSSQQQYSQTLTNRLFYSPKDITLTPLVAAYENHSCKRPAPIIRTPFSCAEGAHSYVRLPELPLRKLESWIF